MTSSLGGSEFFYLCHCTKQSGRKRETQCLPFFICFLNVSAEQEVILCQKELIT